MPEPVTYLEGTAAPLERNHVDTDQIIPARFLKGTVKQGLGACLFYDWRYRPNGPHAEPDLDPDFVLNQPAYAQAPFLVAGHNFGCGSSREHAPWALKDYGFQAILAISFADIFCNNALKNRLLPVALPEPVIRTLFLDLQSQPQQQRIQIEVDAQRVTFVPALSDGTETVAFALNPFWKTCLLKGVDEVGYTLSQADAIDAYETAQLPAWMIPPTLPASIAQ
ncbi:MAG: 3-isopropylmalate dehydratase small subunit [Candidatus Melainabacteria bacterium]|nr:3-isopropylmalate dehydratase small subunit [Candidatus Melainabacteria bacterium]